MKTVRIIAIMLIIVVISLNFASCSKKYSSTIAEDYETYVKEVPDAEKNMPKLSELGNYEAILITRRTPNDPFFDTTDSVALFVKYSDEDFEEARLAAEERYEHIVIPLFNATVRGYTFSVDINSVGALYPEQSLIIGVNEEEKKIAYLSYWDLELDYIRSLEEFIEEKFAFE